MVRDFTNGAKEVRDRGQSKRKFSRRIQFANCESGLGREDGIFPRGSADEQDKISGGRRRTSGGGIVLEEIFRHAGGGGREIEVVGKSVDTGKHSGVAGPAVREEHGFECLLKLHMLAGDDVFVGKDDAIPGAHEVGDYTAAGRVSRARARHAAIFAKRESTSAVVVDKELKIRTERS
jgi:hypothetical protein